MTKQRENIDLKSLASYLSSYIGIQVTDIENEFYKRIKSSNEETEVTSNDQNAGRVT